MYYYYYNYLQIHTGGDMHVTDFSKQSVRFGMIITGVKHILIVKYSPDVVKLSGQHGG